MESEIWKEPPEAPETIATDLSCQGGIAAALRQTLEEIKREELLVMDDAVSNRILQSFGEAILNSYRNPDVPQGPTVRLEGTLDHYNRYQNKWRMVVDEAQFKQIIRSNNSKRSQSAQEEETNTATSKLRLEILAHSDI